ncbi:hypothetical protein DFQ27_006227 [Actinomortierella ambigua]|uniref:HNH nuclease domain-containing protein n=1 Tax=Actinomortierella ambigua TaxID=1343610 RepID=A0A9P6PY45_9FUNG|nr:hypothetical protein DFQ27_006227 [Actinomortierella ambigua]
MTTPRGHVSSSLPQPVLRLSVTKTWSDMPGSMRTLAIDSPEWRALRQRILERDNYTCRFCGTRAAKYMICDHINGNPSNNHPTNLGINCKLCDSVRHCGLAGMNGVLTLGISKMPQKDINRWTLQLYKQLNKVPLHSEIDSKSVIIASDTIDYANELLGLPDSFNYGQSCDCCSIEHTYDMHKGFFTREAETILKNIRDNQ